MPIRPPLIILGASVRAAAQSALRSGYQPFAIDLFADADTQRVAQTTQIKRYPAEFLAALAAAPDAPWMYTGSLENYPRLIVRLAKLRPLIGNGPEALMNVRDPVWLAKILAGSKVRYPETAGGGSQGSGVGGQESGDRSQGSGVNEWLSKPRRSGGGMGISHIQLTPDSRPPTPDPRLLIQRYIPGQPLSASFLARNGDVRWVGAAEQWIGPEWGAPREFQYAGSFAPAAITMREQLQLMQAAKRLALAAGLQGLFGIDLVRNAEGLWLIEVNPRYTASMELFERLSNRCLVAEHCNRDADSPAFEHAAAAAAAGEQAKLIVYATTAGIAGERLQEALIALNAEGVGAADVPRPGTRFPANHPICTLLAGSSAATADIRQKLLAAAAVVRSALDPLR